jgi:hypothetical protein
MTDHDRAHALTVLARLLWHGMAGPGCRLVRSGKVGSFNVIMG